MGIHGFYCWLAQRYPLIRKRMLDLSRPIVNNFYIDFNSVIYTALRSVVMRSENDYKPLFNEIGRILNILIQTIQPNSLIYISVDGSAPFAKNSTQRARRLAKGKDHPADVFDSAAISVGTEFMESLHRFLKTFIERRHREDIFWKVPQIIYSSYRTPGEGEHKIVDFIKKSSFAQDIVHCIYSPDPDVILLALQTRQKNFFLLRQKNSWVESDDDRSDQTISSSYDLEIISLPILKEYISIDFGDQYNLENIIDDFFALTILGGNDFLPPFPDVDIESGQFDIVINCYQKFLAKGRQYLVKEGEFDKNVLHDFLLALSLSLGCFNEEKAVEYISEKFPGETDYSGLEMKLATSTLDCFDWCLKYYTSGVPSWTWAYPFDYSPPIAIVAKYAPAHKAVFALDRPALPLEQLLSITPPRKKSLLPNCLSKLMSPPSQISEFFADNFHGLLSISRLREAFDEAKNELNDEEKKRNTLLDPIPIGDAVSTSLVSQDSVCTMHASQFAITARKERVPVSIFHRQSIGSSIVLGFNSNEKPPSPNELVGKYIYINWPYLIPGMIVYVFDGTKVYPEGTNFLNSSIQKAKSEYLSTQAIDLSSCQVWFGVKSIVYTNSSESQMILSAKNILTVPYFLTSPIMTSSSLNHFFHSIDIQPTVGTDAVFISGPNKGRQCTITSMSPLSVNVKVRSDIPDLSAIIAEDSKRWRPLKQMAASLGLTKEKLLCVISRLISKPEGIDISLPLIQGSLTMEGFCKGSGDSIQFSSDAEAMLKSYFEKEKRLLPYLVNCATDSITEIDGSSIFVSSAKEFADWVKSQVSRYSLVESGLNSLSQYSIEKCEKVLIDNTKKPETSMMSIELGDIYWKGKRNELPFQTSGSSGKRAICISASGPIPFGTSGYIIGMNIAARQLDCIADDSFPDGSYLRGRLTTSRGFTAKVGDLLIIEPPKQKLN